MNPEQVEAHVKGVRQGDRRMLAKTITLIESFREDHQILARAIVDRLLPYTGGALRLGITGVPGVGKSTFIESFGMLLVGKGHRVAVLAVDPSSQRSGGSVMADKTRMDRLSLEPAAFIRPSPAGRTLGGVARRTRETMLVCEAAGFDVLIVETVGVGQSETAVASMTDFFLVLMLAGAGDELQGIKKGVLEFSDAVAITKADGSNVAPAQEARMRYEKAIRLLTPVSPCWQPPVVTCSALTLDGIEGIWAIIVRHHEQMKSSGELTRRRRQQALDWMWALIDDGLKERFMARRQIRKRLQALQAEVEAGRLVATAAAEELLIALDRDRGY